MIRGIVGTRLSITHMRLTETHLSQPQQRLFLAIPESCLVGYYFMQQIYLHGETARQSPAQLVPDTIVPPSVPCLAWMKVHGHENGRCYNTCVTFYLFHPLLAARCL